ncbi:MAG: hypothetical protein NC048_08220 [Bacteroides sp.]|nr:hypothetical protein [Ruminococcus flavefaciens]MCM1555085.1 hypothetical protein [Bacteroides sp.]MCM1555464.1 hypothetical protein [Bacteroides sp.]
MKTFKPFLSVVLFLFVTAPGWALLPPHFTEELFEISPNTRPSRIILKYFTPIDKGFKVEIGSPINNILVVDMKDNRKTACWEYDLRGNLKEKYELEYNNYGNLSIVRKKDQNQNAQIREEYFYANPKDANSLKEKRVYSSTDLRMLCNEQFMRDKKGKVSVVRHLDEGGKEKYSDNYYYNIDGWVESEIRTEPSGNKRSETEKSYDEEGRVISEIVYDGSGKTLAQSKYTYNVKGLPATIVMTTAGGKTEYYTVEYTYDERGNWIQQVIYKGMGRMPETVLVRLINY